MSQTIQSYSKFLIFLLVIISLPTPALADGVLVNPSFTFSQGSDSASFRVTFASDPNADSYTVKIYDSKNSYASSSLTVNNYISGQDISGTSCSYSITGTHAADDFCYKIRVGYNFKATITANPIQGVTGPGESAKSNTIGIIDATAPLASANQNIQSQSGLYFNFSSAADKATSATLYLYRTSDGLPTSDACTVTSGGTLDVLYQTISGLAITNSTFVALEGKYCYTWAVKYSGSSTPNSQSITWYDSRVGSKYNGVKYSPLVISPPTNLVAVPGDKVISLSWTAPTGTDVAVANYKVELSTDGGYWFYPYLTPTGQAYPFLVAGSATSTVISGYLRADNGALMPLENGTHYYIRMIAIGALPDYLKSSSANYSGTATPATTPAELPSGSAAPKNGSVDLA